MRDDLLQLIKRAALDAVEATKPAAVVFASVRSLSPLEVSINQKLILSRANLTLTARAATTDYLEEGDRVMLLRVQGGKQYVLLDKVR